MKTERKIPNINYPEYLDDRHSCRILWDYDYALDLPFFIVKTSKDPIISDLQHQLHFSPKYA